MSETKHDMTTWLTRAALGAALVLTASAEYELARRAGYGEWVSAALPMALDAYVVAALRARREVLVTVLAAVVVNGVSHLVTTDVIKVNAWIIVGVSALAPLILWRVHVLAGHDPKEDTPAVGPDGVDAPAMPAPQRVFTRADLLEATAALAFQVAQRRPVLSHGWTEYGAEVPPAKGGVNTEGDTVNTPAARVDTPAATDLQARVLELLDGGNGVRATARIAGCSPAYVSKVKKAATA